MSDKIKQILIYILTIILTALGGSQYQQIQELHCIQQQIAQLAQDK